MTRFLMSCLCVLLAGRVAAADTPTGGEQPVGSVERTHSINASPLGVLSGSYALNYERLFGSHGLIGEATFVHSSDDSTSSTGGGAAVGYRWHWRGRQNSGFVGVNVGYAIGTASSTVEDNGMSSSFDVDAKVLTVTANIGKRWAFANGLNVTFRIGGGYGQYDVTTDSQDPLAQRAVEAVDDLLHFLPIAFDGELSVGYAF
jgi:hypothetical protein